MLENVTAARARIEDIKSHFRTAQAGGEVSGAPHAASLPGPKGDGSVQPYFPDYLSKAVQTKVKGTVEGASAYDDLIDSAAAKNGIDPALLKAVIQAESGFNTNAMSGAGAKGLMQLMPGTARALGVSDPFDAAQSIEGGARYLKQQITRFGDESLALAAYNAGPGAVLKHGGVPPFRETQNYVSKVLSYKEAYSSR